MLGVLDKRSEKILRKPVAEFVKSVRCDLCVVRGIIESTVKHLNHFYDSIIALLLYQNDVKIYSDLVSLYFHRHNCKTASGTLRSHALLTSKPGHCLCFLLLRAYS